MGFDQRAVPRILTTADAERLGVSRSARRHGVRARGWQPLARGVILTRDETPTREDWAAVGLAMSGPAAALSGWDAVRIRGLGARVPPSRTVLVLDREGTNRRVGDVLIRPTPRPFDTTLLPGEHPTLPYASVVTTARAIADTALCYDRLDAVRALVTSAIQRGRCRPDELIAELESCPRGGSRWFRRALADIVVNARSVAEAEAVDLLRAARVPAFELNVPVVDRSGEVVAVLDILWRALRAVAEIDSREFHFSEHDWQRTLARHNRLTRLGLAVEHHAPSAIRTRRRTWAVELRDWLRSRADELGVDFIAGDGPLAHRGPPPPLFLPVIKRAKRP